jgi:molecular chaperone DnaK (HSP70)
VSARYTVGIDLGTSHTVVAYTDPEAREPIRVFDVERRVALNQNDRKPTLPSVLYAPLPEEVLADESWVVGDYARQRGREVAGRAILSTKSWLCHAAVDREAAILPWGAPADCPHLSPVDASSLILQHVRQDWDRRMPGAPLAEQQVILTVPASFDPIARQLTAKAAASAGLFVRLLEEPQAAFYDYLDRNGLHPLELELAQIHDRPLRILVCDVGGGTTDLTLLAVSKRSDELFIDRTAVGRHLLLGGDNMDLTLAHLAESALHAEQRLSAQDLAQWVLMCRDAKERLLQPDAVEEIRVAIAGSGSALVGGSRSATLRREQVRSTLLDGFFPLVEPGTRLRMQRTALVGFGLPYESDPSISSHISAFLDRHQAPGERIDFVLLNGGVFLAPILAERLLQVLAQLGQPAKVLQATQFDLAVARGAVKYGLSLNGKALKIGGGSSHGYYIGFDAPGSRRQAVCVVPRGAPEGELYRAAAQPFTLRLGQPVRFELYSSDLALADAAGKVVSIDEQLELLPPLVTQLGDPQSEARELAVTLEGELTAVGTLDIHCVPADKGRDAAIALAFELRGQERAANAGASTRPLAADGSERLAEAYEAIQRVFGKGRSDVEPRETKDLVRTLERLLGPRRQWTLNTNRALFDVIGPKHQSRRRSPDHERVYWMLAGYTLRPGFGHILDRQRVELLAPVLKSGLNFVDNVRGWQQFLIAWRRILPGMNEQEQTDTLAVLAKYAGRSATRAKPQRGFQNIVQPELLDLLGLVERVPSQQRAALGNALIERTWTESEARLWDVIARLGARVPAYASVHYVIDAEQVQGWLEQLLREQWGPTAVSAAARMARRTGDRARDIRDSLRQAVVARLKQERAPEVTTQLVVDVVPVAPNEGADQFGEELPVGLVWRDSDS